MSELKAYEGDCILNEEVYLKSEADKVIAEKDAEIAELQKQVHDYGLGLYVMQARAEKEARHDKYKRCVAMADICDAMSYFYKERNENILMTAEEKRRWWLFERWYGRWLELAEKFKEVTK